MPVVDRDADDIYSQPVYVEAPLAEAVSMANSPVNSRDGDLFSARDATSVCFDRTTRNISEQDFGSPGSTADRLMMTRNTTACDDWDNGSTLSRFNGSLVDVSPGDVGSFVTHVQRVQQQHHRRVTSDSGSVQTFGSRGGEGFWSGVGAPGMPTDIQGSMAANNGLQLTKEQEYYLITAATRSEALGRLQEIEGHRRSDLFGRYIVTMRLLSLAARRITPVMRRRQVPPGALVAAPPGGAGAAPPSRRPPRPSVLVIHHKDVSIADPVPPPSGPPSRRHHVDPNSRSPRAGVLLAPPSMPSPRQNAHHAVGAPEAESQSPTSTLHMTNSRAQFVDQPSSSQAVDSDLYSTDDLPVTSRTQGIAASSPAPTDGAPSGGSPLDDTPVMGGGATPLPPPAAQYELLELSALRVVITTKSKVNVAQSWDLLSTPGAAENLSRGETYFRFKCKSCGEFTPDDVAVLKMFVNRTGFEDELRDNNSAPIDIDSSPELKKFVGVLVKSMYILPGIRLADVTRALLVEPEYHRQCQPGSPKVFDDVEEPHTFRSCKVVLKFVLSVVIQMRVTEITDPAVLATFAASDGIVPAKVMLMERTKRDKTKTDSTTKCKTTILYFPITGGLLVSMTTVILNTSVPSIVASVVNNFGGRGAVEAGETADNTRRFMTKRFGDTRLHFK